MLVRSCNNTMLHGNSFCFTPEWCDFDLVDAIAPRVPLRETWFIQPIRELQLIQFAARKTSHFNQ